MHAAMPDAAKLMVVGIGASAGGLEACIKLVDKIPRDLQMAFILVQHLDPRHESMMVSLLASHTSLIVWQAEEAMPLEAGHFYVIPPGKYLAVSGGALRLTPPQAAHGSRMPFDFLLNSLAAEFGERAIAVVLSGTGSDGSLGIQEIHAHGGKVIAQKPEEAAFDGMPRSAIATGIVDHVLPAAEIPAALLGPALPKTAARIVSPEVAAARTPDSLRGIVELLRASTAHDFTLYKPGTIKRRIERRMAMAGIGAGDMARYLEALREDAGELELLGKDFLINITDFFRDPKVFEYLATEVLPGLVRGHKTDQPMRIWVAGCSTGEETYSLAMLFSEEIAAAKSKITLQIFASDADAEAITGARVGLYPANIKAKVSPDRLARFFAAEEHGYRVLPELRGMVVFTVQDVLVDPPFSRLDFVSCRNLLIYLGTEAQAKAIAAFHFALREGGILLLGNSETIGIPDGRFETLSKKERVYRRIGHNRPGEFGLSFSVGEAVRIPARMIPVHLPTRQNALADLCRRAVQDSYAPAAILINHKLECLFFSGPTDKYLRVASGHPTQDLMAMTPQGIRIKLRAAIQRAIQENRRVIVGGGLLDSDRAPFPFRIEVKPVPYTGEDLLLVCFVDEPERKKKRGRLAAGTDLPHVDELERELQVTRTELQSAIRNLEVSIEEQKVINEEAMSVNEEFQSTNEELLTSKEELQSLNEELTALNSQLQETLERQRTTSNDLQNILYSTDVATLFLDRSLNIRFFTPATKSLFNVIPSDIGRPLADLHSLSADIELPADARSVLKILSPVDREIEAQDGKWFLRRILPYRGHDNSVEGIVITFTDITERKRIRQAMDTARQGAEQANLAKSRFLAAASHDLRQPLQTLALLQGLLAKKVEGDKAKKLIVRLDETLVSMSEMLNTLLDINQIDSGIIQPQLESFPINGLLDRLRAEFSYHAAAQGITLRVIGCGLAVETDPRLLEQMLRNLVTNALKYTRTGKVLLGCRRQGLQLSIEVWDTGIGIAKQERQAIFDEYHQVDNAARERSRGLGLGLSIVQRLADLLGHRVSVRSNVGKGSVFAIEAPMTVRKPLSARPSAPAIASRQAKARRTAVILLVEDDPRLRELLETMLVEDGHIVHASADGHDALEQAAKGKAKPDLILADYNLPSGMNGLQVIAGLRKKLEQHVPAIVLTGDIAAPTLRDIARLECTHLSKPVRSADLLAVIQRLLQPSMPVAATLGHEAPVELAGGTIYIVDDDPGICDAMLAVFREDGQGAQAFSSCEAFLRAYRPGEGACLLVDAYLPGMSGMDLLRRLRDTGAGLPSILITGNSDVAMAVEAMKAGASDFIEKPIGAAELVAIVARVVEQARDSAKRSLWQADAAGQVARLTQRQHQIMDRVLAGQPNKNIAADLGISQRTVETHRASIMKKTGAQSLPALARLAQAAAWSGKTPATAEA